jgi:hypothetical protein
VRVSPVVPTPSSNPPCMPENLSNDRKTDSRTSGSVRAIGLEHGVGNRSFADAFQRREERRALSPRNPMGRVEKVDACVC